MNMIILKKTNLSEIDKVIEIESKYENSQFILPYSKELHQQAINSEDKLHLSIIDNQKLIGFVILAGIENFVKSIEFRRIVIDENYKGKGIGRKIIKQIKKICFSEYQCEEIWLDVYDFNKRAIHLYKTEGFKKKKTDKNLIIMTLKKPEYDELQN